MLSWRDGGIVQDSDDEGDLSNVDATSHTGPDEAQLELQRHTDTEQLQDGNTSGEVTGKRGPGTPPVFEDRCQNDSSTAEASDCSESNSFDRNAYLYSYECVQERATPPQHPSSHNGTQQVRTPTFLSEEQGIAELQDGHLHRSPTKQRAALRVHVGLQNESERRALEPEYHDIFDIPSSSPSNISSPSRTGGSFRVSGIQSHAQLLLSPRAPSSADTHLTLTATSNFAHTCPQVSADIHGRRFRPRNPIQIHPYLLESEAYRNALRARGVRPVTVAGTQPGGAAAEATQIQHSSGQDQGESGSCRSGSGFRSSVLSASTPDAVAEASLWPEEDELLKYDVLLRRSTTFTPVQQRKRRKLSHIFGNKHQSPDIEVLSGLQNQVNSPYHTETSAITMPRNFPQKSFNNLNSPPKSIPKTLRLKRFKFPAGLSPVPLPTPAPSSELETIQLDDFDLDSHSTDDLGLLDQPDVLSSATSQPAADDRRKSSSSSPTTSATSTAESEHIRRARNRIKGVLPASWIRLDAQARTRPRSFASRLTPSRSLSLKTPPKKGVARPVRPDLSWKHHCSDGNDRPAREIHTLDHANLLPSPLPWNNQQSEYARHSPSPWDVHSKSVKEVSSEAEEEGGCDQAPVPAVCAERPSPQLTLYGDDGLPQAYTRGWQTSSKSQLSTMIKKIRGIPNRLGSQAQETRPRISVLDAQGQTTLGSTTNFVRIATRQARCRTGRGRHSPYQKLLPLHNQAEGAEMDDVLYEWTHGTIAPRYAGRSSRPAAWARRRPLAERSHNIHRKAVPQFKRRVTRRKTRSTSVDPLLANTQTGTHTWQAEENLDTSNVSPLMSPAIGNRARETVSAQIVRQIDSTGRLSQMGLFIPRRPGQLEELQPEYYVRYQDIVFRENMIKINNHSHERNAKEVQNFDDLVFSRFWKDDNPAAPAKDLGLPSQAQQRISVDDWRWNQHRQPDRPSRKVEVGSVQRHRPRKKPMVQAQIVRRYPPMATGPGRKIPLLSCGMTLTGNLDIDPLPPGSYFHSSTFIGSGDLRDAFMKRNLNLPVKSASILWGESHVSCGPWNEELSTFLRKMFTHLAQIFEGNMVHRQNCEQKPETPSDISMIPALLRPVIRYYCQSLHFLNPADREFCVRDSTDLINTLLKSVKCSLTSLSTVVMPNLTAEEMALQTLMYLTVLSAQIYEIASQELEDKSFATHARELLCNIARTVISRLADRHLPDLRSTLEQLVNSEAPEIGVRSGGWAAEVVVVVAYVLDRMQLDNLGFMDLVSDCLGTRISNACNDVQIFDSVWQDMLTFLPLLEVDPCGILKPGARYTSSSHENWRLVKIILDQVFELYEHNITTPCPITNSYIRATFIGCHNLIRHWGWRKCDVVINTLFDFFARNDLALLRNEIHTGSTITLDRLSALPFQTIEPRDNSYHIFLKILGTGLLGMRMVYPDRKIRNIAWRLVPAHGRVYKKDEELHRYDLDALENHHDLLCVLYAASPASFRPSLDLIRNLVDCTTSHLEVCRLNVRSWANLTRYQLSLDEPPDNVQPFASWYNQVLRQLISQFKLARTEAESVFVAAKHGCAATVSVDALESTVSSNQRQLIAVLSTLLALMRDVITAASNKAAAMLLFRSSHTAEVFSIFDGKQTGWKGAVEAALEVYETYLMLVDQSRSASTAQQMSDDSQGYGEWSDLEQAFDSTQTTPSTYVFNESIADTIQLFLSQCCQAEQLVDDLLLAKIVGLFVTVAKVLVNTGQRQWTSYLDSHSPFSWHQLPKTVQSQKYLSYFTALIMTLDPDNYRDNSDAFICVWLVSLVEQESMLTYQHLLTTTLLGCDPDNPLFHNLPFVKNVETNRYEISQHDLRERRLSLISSILGNMCQIHKQEHLAGTDGLLRHEQEFTMLLTQFMAAMKKNYQDTEHGSSMRTQYVKFVHRVVEFLQQYTSDICPVEKFFTDSTAFPLPTTDPMYVVGRLKGYGMRLGEHGMQKTLVGFVQTVCERAAVESQQTYLVGQLVKAVECFVENESHGHPSLGRVLCEAVIPAYVETTVISDCGWILAVPMLEAASCVFDNMLFNTSFVVKSSLISVTSTITVLLESLRQVAAAFVRIHKSFQAFPVHVVKVLVVIFNTVSSTVALVDYIQRLSNTVTYLVQYLGLFRSLGALFGKDSEQAGESLTWESGPENDSSRVTSSFAEVRAFSKRHLVESLSRRWVKHGDRYYVSHGNSRQEVVTPVKSEEEEKHALLAAVADLNERMERTPSFSGRGRRAAGGHAMPDVHV